MEQTITVQAPTAAELQHYHDWWASLSIPWKIAFNETMLRRTSAEALPDDVLHAIWTAPAMRFAGPSAPYPNMSVELDDLSGIEAFPQLEVFVFTHHKITSLASLAKLPWLKSLFVFDNQITALDGVEVMSGLQELYFQSNLVKSLRPLEGLTALHTVYCPYNRLESLEGIGQQHAASLKNFTGLPNDNLPATEVTRFEHELGIPCRRG